MVDKVLPTVLSPLRRPPRHPVPAARMLLPGLLPVTALARRFKSDEARALLAGAAAHSMLPLSSALTGSYGLLFIALGHAYGWPVVEGGSSAVVDGLVAELGDLGVKLHLGTWVKSLDELPAARAALVRCLSSSPG